MILRYIFAKANKIIFNQSKLKINEKVNVEFCSYSGDGRCFLFIR
jgi:hypothetical protein